MKQLIAFDLDGTLAESKQPLDAAMGEALADLLDVVDVAVISGGDWPQFETQVASRLPARANIARLWLMPTTGTKLYTHGSGAWRPVYAELFADDEKQLIFGAFDASLEATRFVPETVWGERVEDRGSQITFSALGQKAPIDAKEKWDPDFAKRKVIQRDLRPRLPGLSVCVRDPCATRAVIDTIIACLKPAPTVGAAVRHASAANDRAQSVLGAEA